MCQLCDQPDLTTEEYDDQIRALLDQHRFVLQAVGGSRSRAEFSYTVGLTAHGLPELVVTGLRVADASQLLRHWGNYLLDTSLVLPGETLESGMWVMEAVEVELAWADARGFWPWEPGHRGRRAGQPLLGRRAAVFCDEHRPDRLDVPPSLP
ncbi:MAG: DUF4262 domain-containing protein [Actinobacteria bacterium]|nr:DUF4262 domain-containing protein [Actinomycetota bacterium]